MKTTLDGVVFLLPHVSSHAKTEFHRRRIFPGPREEGGNGMRRPGESCRTRTVGRQNEAAERGSKMDSRTERRTRRQDRAAGRGSKMDGRTRRKDRTAEQGSKTERQEGAVRWTAGQSGRTGRRTRRQNRAAGRSGKTEQQDGAARRSGKTERQKKRGRAKPGHRSGQVRGRRPHKQKNGIPTAGSRRTAKKRTEKQPGICKRPTHRFSIRCSDTGKGAILSARPPLVK